MQADLEDVFDLGYAINYDSPLEFTQGSDSWVGLYRGMSPDKNIIFIEEYTFDENGKQVFRDRGYITGIYLDAIDSFRFPVLFNEPREETVLNKKDVNEQEDDEDDDNDETYSYYDDDDDDDYEELDEDDYEEGDEEEWDEDEDDDDVEDDVEDEGEDDEVSPHGDLANTNAYSGCRKNSSKPCSSETPKDDDKVATNNKMNVVLSAVGKTKTGSKSVSLAGNPNDVLGCLFYIYDWFEPKVGLQSLEITLQVKNESGAVIVNDFKSYRVPAEFTSTSKRLLARVIRSHIVEIIKQADQGSERQKRKSKLSGDVEDADMKKVMRMFNLLWSQRK